MGITSKEMRDLFIGEQPEKWGPAVWELIENMDEWLPWLAARQYDGSSLTRTEHGWLLVIKAMKGRQPQVAFFGGDEPAACYQDAAYAIALDLVRWKEDIFRSMRSDKK